MRRGHVTDDDLDLDYMSTARSTDRMKNALIDSMDESYNKSRRADQKLMMDIDSRLNEPVYPERKVVHTHQTVSRPHSGYIVVRAPASGLVRTVPKRAVSVAPTSCLRAASVAPVVRTIRVPGSSTEVVVRRAASVCPGVDEISYGPVVVPTRTNSSTRRVTSSVSESPVSINYRSDEIYPSAIGTEVSFRRRLLDRPSYESQSRKYDDMRTRLAHANQKLKEHRSLTEHHYDSPSYSRQPPAVTGLNYDYSTENARFSEPPISDVRRRARAVLAKSKGRAY